MKKSLVALALGASVLSAGLVGCKDNTAEIAVVTDVGLLMDGGFNQGTYEGAKKYAEEHGKSYKYYQPANGSSATDEDRIEAMRNAIKNGAKIIVAPGFLQATAMETVAKESPDVKFVFVDGWAMGLDNVTAIVYKEQESGFLAGYAAVKDGFRKLGGTFGGGGANPACNRFAYGFAQGADAAAAQMNLPSAVEMKVSFKYGAAFSASPELQAQISGWYNAGTEVVFSCGGSMVNSVIAAAQAAEDKWVIGVDVDQASLYNKVLTSAVKGLAPSVEKVLGQFYEGKWDDELKDTAQNLGAAENATGLPTADNSWRFRNFTKDEYNSLFEDIAGGRVDIDATTADDMNAEAAWAEIDGRLSHITIELDK